MRNYIINKNRLFLILVMQLSLFIGCGKIDESEQITLRYLVQGSSIEVSKIGQTIVDEFQKENPHVKVKMEIVPRDYYTKLQTLMAGGISPDVVWIDDFKMRIYAEKGLLLDLAPFIDEDEDFNLDDYFPYLIEMCKYKERIYALPHHPDFMMLYYNKDLFDKEGIEYPDDTWDWDDFLEAARKLTKDTNGDGRIDQFGCNPNTWFPMWMSFVWQNGGEVLSEDNRYCLLDQPAAIEAIQFIADLSLKHHVAPSIAEMADRGTGPMFETGRIAMVSNLRGIVPRYRELHFRWDVAPLTKRKRRATFLDGTLYSISNATNHPRESYELLKYTCGLASQIKCTQTGQIFPSLKSIAYSEVFLDPNTLPENDDVYLPAIEEYGRRHPQVFNWEEVLDTIDRELGKAWLGILPPNEACQELVPKVNALLSREGKK